MGMRQCTGGHWYDDSKYTACPYCNNAASNLSGGMQGEDSKTIALSDKEPKPDTGEEGYITGWLVCTQGPDKGTDYRIFRGQNFVGRDFSMDIVIRGDSKVSRIKHCCVVYDNKSNRTFLVPENGCYVEYKGSILASPAELKSYDEFKLGDSTLTYVAFCEGGRKWEEN